MTAPLSRKVFIRNSVLCCFCRFLEKRFGKPWTPLYDGDITSCVERNFAVVLSSQLKLLANGVNPETGEVLDEGSLTNKPEVIRILFALAEELSGLDKPKTKKPKLTLDERRQRNMAEGRPLKSHFPWAEEERVRLIRAFARSSDVSHLSAMFERSVLAIAVQLQRSDLISEEELESYRLQQART